MGRRRITRTLDRTGIAVPPQAPTCRAANRALVGLDAALGVAGAGADSPAAGGEHRDAEYTVAGRRIELTDGVAEAEAAPGSAAMLITRYFCNEALGDLNADGRPDVAFFLTQDTGGSGVSCYVVAALETLAGYAGSHAFLIGDRIAPQGFRIDADGTIVASYADRAAGEPFAVRPSVGKSVRLALDPRTLQFAAVDGPPPDPA